MQIVTGKKLPQLLHLSDPALGAPEAWVGARERLRRGFPQLLHSPFDNGEVGLSYSQPDTWMEASPFGFQVKASVCVTVI